MHLLVVPVGRWRGFDGLLRGLSRLVAGVLLVKHFLLSRTFQAVPEFLNYCQGKFRPVVACSGR